MDAQEQKMLEMMQEMLASQAESLRLLTEQIAEKDRINKALEQRVAELSAQLAWFQRQMFGRKSEKIPLMDPNQMSLFDEPIAPEVVQAQEVATEQIEKETQEERKLMKLLHAEDGGMVMYVKRLEAGRFRMPAYDPESKTYFMEWRDWVVMVEGIVESPQGRLRRLRAERTEYHV